MEVLARESVPAYNGTKEVKEFDETKAGVKGLVDSGVVKIPRFFIQTPENLPKASDISNSQLEAPVIDLQGANGDRRMEIIDEIRRASETWGFFQIVNHRVPINILEEMTDGVRRFHEQPKETKMEFYSRDAKRKFKYFSNNSFCNFDEPHAWNWKYTIMCLTIKWIRIQMQCLLFAGIVSSTDDCSVCSNITVEYLKHIIAVKNTLSELLSEALRLDRNHLKHIECMETHVMLGHYYPICPGPDLTLGTGKHSDSGFLTILLQGNIGGLQVLHGDQWVDVIPVKGALAVNAGDLLQLITNDKFISREHKRVLARPIGPRISVVCLFNPSVYKISDPYRPLEEFIADDDPPRYRETTVSEFIAHFKTKGLDGNSTLSHFKQA